MISRQGFKYSYGRRAQLNVVKRKILYLPINDKDKPDYEYMKQYIINMKHKKIKQYLDYTKTTS